MDERIRIYVAESHDPWLNLATEAWLFQSLDDFDQALFLWRNHDTVVIGRSQNPWLECKLDAMDRDGVLLARRQSGGGAVYHDLGNTNFTFLSKKNDYDKCRNLKIITGALKQLGIDAKFSGRNDILLEEPGRRKISGNAFKEKADRAFHHGTLLVNANLTRLADYLNPHKKKLQAKGVASVKSRVANLVDVVPGIDHMQLSEQIMAQFCQTYQVDVEPRAISLVNLQHNQSLQQSYQQLKSWDWRYGQTLPFSHRFDQRFDWGLVDVHLVVKHGVIEQAKIYSDALQPEWLETLAQTLPGHAYAPETARLCFERDLGAVEADHLTELLLWMQQQMQ